MTAQNQYYIKKQNIKRQTNKQNKTNKQKKHKAGSEQKSSTQIKNVLITSIITYKVKILVISKNIKKICFGTYSNDIKP